MLVKIRNGIDSLPRTLPHEGFLVLNVDDKPPVRVDAVKSEEAGFRQNPKLPKMVSKFLRPLPT